MKGLYGVKKGKGTGLVGPLTAFDFSSFLRSDSGGSRVLNLNDGR